MGDLRALLVAYLTALDADIAACEDREATVRLARTLGRSLAALPFLRAALATPADTGWHDSPPTTAEVIAHAERNEVRPGVGSWMWRDVYGLEHIAYLHVGRVSSWIYWRADMADHPRECLPPGAVAWRPLDKGEHAPWPEVA